MATKPSSAGKALHKSCGEKNSTAEFPKKAWKGRERDNKGFRNCVVEDGELPWLRAKGAIYTRASGSINHRDRAGPGTGLCHLHVLMFTSPQPRWCPAWKNEGGNICRGLSH